MKRFIIADGLIQGILTIASIACIPFFYNFREYIQSPFFSIVYALIGWQLFSSIKQVLKRNSLPKNRYLYGLQLIFLAYCGFIAHVFVMINYLIVPDCLSTILGYLFLVGIFTLLPSLIISIAFLTVKRLFIRPMPLV
jgi:hypothetical protein